MALYQSKTRRVYAFQMTKEAGKNAKYWPEWALAAKQRGRIFARGTSFKDRVWHLRAKGENNEPVETMIPWNTYIVTSIGQQQALILVPPEEFEARWEPADEGFIMQVGIEKNDAARAAVDDTYREQLLDEFAQGIRQRMEEELTSPGFPWADRRHASRRFPL